MASRLIDGLEEQRTIFRPAPIRALADTGAASQYAETLRSI